MTTSLSPRRTLKRGALIAAANWPIVVVQATTDAVFKVIVAVPIVGGILLAALVIGAEPPALLTLDVRDLIATIVALLTARPATLTAFVAAVGTAVAGGSMVVCAVKAGTVATIVASEATAGPVEEPPVDPVRVGDAGLFSIERFGADVRRFGWRFVQLGAGLLVAYALAGVAYVRLVFGGSWVGAWITAALATAILVLAVTAVNLFYLLAQVALVSEDCGPVAAWRGAVRLLGRAWRPTARVFGAVLVIVTGTTVASLLATGALGLVGFVPLVWFAVLPLQLGAWVLRALVFQYLAVGALASYASVYRAVSARPPANAPEALSVPVVREAG